MPKPKPKPSPTPKAKARGTSKQRAAQPSAKTPRVATSTAAARKASKKKKAAKRSVTPGGPSKSERVSPEEEAAFAEALIRSGQAACLDRDGNLPAGATHKIVEDPAGEIKVVRRRFSIT